MTTGRRVHYDYQDYLGALELSDIKLEYCDGEIYAMAGGTPTHAALSAAASALLRTALIGRCLPYSSDLKVRVEATDLTTYPDVTVVCGERHTAAIDRHAVINPTLLVEVTSNSTEGYDRGDKLSHYKQLPSLQAVLFISHRRKQITIVERTATGWTQRDVRGSEHVRVESLDLTMSVDELYADIELEAS